MTRADLIATLAARVASIDVSHTARVAIDGPDAAGKTTLADDLALALGPRAIRIGTDEFHRPVAILRRRPLLDPEGYYRDSFDSELIADVLLRPLGPEGDGWYAGATFDGRIGQTSTTAPRLAPPGSVLICDGVFLLRPQLRDHWEYAVYLHVDPEESIRRARTRDLGQFGSVDEVERRYRGRYMPGQALYRDEARPIERADVVIDNSDPERPVMRTSHGPHTTAVAWSSAQSGHGASGSVRVQPHSSHSTSTSE